MTHLVHRLPGSRVRADHERAGCLRVFVRCFHVLLSCVSCMAGRKDGCAGCSLMSVQSACFIEYTLRLHISMPCWGVRPVADGWRELVGRTASAELGAGWRVPGYCGKTAKEGTAETPCAVVPMRAGMVGNAEQWWGAGEIQSRRCGNGGLRALVGKGEYTEAAWREFWLAGIGGKSGAADIAVDTTARRTYEGSDDGHWWTMVGRRRGPHGWAGGLRASVGRAARRA